MVKPTPIKTNRRIFLFGLVGLFLASCKNNAPQLQASTDMALQLESSAFAADGLIPAQYTCDGENISPALAWATPPEGTRSLALIMDDPDALGGTFVHWVLYDLPPETRQFAEAVPAQPILVDGGTQGKNGFGRYGYGGPCPPSGTHRYFFRLYALDTVLDLAPGLTKAETIAAMEGHVLAIGELIGRYQRQ